MNQFCDADEHYLDELERVMAMINSFILVRDHSVLVIDDDKIIFRGDQL